MSSRKKNSQMQWNRPQPDGLLLHHWENYAGQLMIEYAQCMDEGRDMEPLKALFETVHALPESPEKAQLADILYAMAMKAPMREGYPYREPSDYEEIQQLCRGQRICKTAVDEALWEKIRGAWYGRICGCLLGKPIEGFYRSEMLPLLEGTGNYPLHSYIRQADIDPELRKKFDFDVYHRCYADTLDCAPADDDTNYTVMAGEILQRFGPGFTSQDVADYWQEAQPKTAYCTAERVAYCNRLNGFPVPVTAQHKNPYRELIGAQIRGDYYGYVHPGDPKGAAEMAFRDAAVSHTANGIYGAMFVAAMLAWAAVSRNTEEVLLAGLDEIPDTSRLHHRIREVLELYRQEKTYDDVIALILRDYNDEDPLDWGHTISNAMIVTAALLYGGGDYGKSICLAVQPGFDTDCNGATVGSIVGMLKGLPAIDSTWLEPVRGYLDTDLLSVGKVSVESLCRRTVEHIQLIQSQKAAQK